MIRNAAFPIIHGERKTTSRPSSSPTLSGESRPEHGGDDPAAEQRDEPGRGADERKRDPRRVHDVLCGAFRIHPTTRQRSGRDEGEREGRRADEGRGEQIGVGEARHAALTGAGGEPERNQVEALEGDRHRRAVGKAPEPVAQPQRDPAMPPQTVSSYEQDGERQTDRDRTVQSQPPRE